MAGKSRELVSRVASLKRQVTSPEDARVVHAVAPSVEVCTSQLLGPWFAQ
jgi:hypothetical protein